MHPNKFADEVIFKVNDWDFGNSSDTEFRELLKMVHPRNILNGVITSHLFELTVSYMTSRYNYKTTKKYLFLDSAEIDGIDSPTFVAEVIAGIKLETDCHMIDPSVTARYLCKVVLPIG